MQNQEETVVEVFGTVNGKFQALPPAILKEVLLTLLQLEGKIVIVDQTRPAEPTPQPPVTTEPVPQPIPQPQPEPTKPTDRYSEAVSAVLGVAKSFHLPDGHYDLGDLPAGFSWDGRTKTLSAKPEKAGIWTVAMKNETGTVGSLAITVTGASTAPAAEQPAPKPEPAPVEQHQSQAQPALPLDRNATGIVIKSGTAVAAGQPVTFITIQSDADKNVH